MKKIFLFFISLLLYTSLFSQIWEYKEGIYSNKEYSYGSVSGEIFGIKEKPLLVFKKYDNKIFIFILNNEFDINYLEDYNICFDNFNIKYTYKTLKIKNTANILFIPITKELIDDFKNKHICYVQLKGSYNYDIIMLFSLDKSRAVINKILK